MSIKEKLRQWILQRLQPLEQEFSVNFRKTTILPYLLNEISLLRMNVRLLEQEINEMKMKRGTKK